MNYHKRLLLMSLSDASIVSIAVLLSYLVRFDFQLIDPDTQYIPITIMEHVLITLISLHLTKMYRTVMRFASNSELITIIKTTTIVELVIFSCNVIVQYSMPDFVVPRSIYLMTWAFIILGIGGSRFVWKLVADFGSKIQPQHNRTLIVGAGCAGVLVAREMKQSPNSDQVPVAFIDDDPAKQKLHVYGMPVVGTRESIPEIVELYSVLEVVIAMPSAPKQEIKQIFDICKTTKANVKILPYVSDILSGKISIDMIREVKIEDLLGRDPVQINLEEISQYIMQEEILITGAGGSIGSELCRQIANFSPKKLLLLGHGENSIFEISMELKRKFPHLVFESIIADIQDRQSIREVMTNYRPSVVFHAAAHKHVPLMENNPMEAIKNNVLGTKNVAECAHECGVSRFVLISTDKAVNPTSVMGATKRIAEMMIQGLNKVSETKFSAVRFGNVLGSRGSVIPIFLYQIQQGGPVTVTHPDMVRFFMTIPEAAQLVIQAGALAEGGEIFVLDMGKPVNISDMAQDLIRLSGFEPNKDINVVYTGIRLGEKLYEEILTSEEGTMMTKHNRIFIGKPVDFSWKTFQKQISELEQLIHRSSKQNIRREVAELLQVMVPNYQNQGGLSESNPHVVPLLVSASTSPNPSPKVKQARIEVPIHSELL